VGQLCGAAFVYRLGQQSDRPLSRTCGGPNDDLAAFWPFQRNGLNKFPHMKTEKLAIPPYGASQPSSLQ
jgi:hypothetical protein